MADAADDRAMRETLALSASVIAQVVDGLVRETAEREDGVRREWADEKPLLEQKAWTTAEQLKILEAEVAELHAKIAKLDERQRERQAKVSAAFKGALAEFYVQHNPAKLRDVDQLLRHFTGREHEILDKLQERYGVSVDPGALEAAGIENGRDLLLVELARKKDDLWEQVARVEELVQRSNEELERVKRELFFPLAEGWRFKHGAEGVYFGMKDFWMESLSSTLSLSILDRVPEPRVLVTLGGSAVEKWTSKLSFDQSPSTPPGSPSHHGPSGATNSPGGGAGSGRGAVVSFMLQDCGLTGEKGTKVPTLRPKQLKLLVELSVTMPVEFSRVKNAWSASKGFQLRIVRIERQFKGTLAIPRSLLRMVLNRVLPSVVKSAVLKAIPPELGRYLSRPYTSPEPGAQDGQTRAMHIDIDIGVAGIPGNLDAFEAALTAPDADAAAVAMRAFLHLSREQSRTFVAASDAVAAQISATCAASRSGKPAWAGPLHTASDLVAFFNRFSDASHSAEMARQAAQRMRAQGIAPGAPTAATTDPGRETWEALVGSFQQLVDKFARASGGAGVCVAALFERVRNLTQKPMKQHTEIRNVRLRGSVDAALDMARDFLLRSAKERHSDRTKRRVRLTKSLPKEEADILAWHAQAREPVEYIKQTVQDVSAVVQGHGTAGDFMFSGHDVKFAGPVSLSLPFEESLYPPTHFAISTCVSQEEGAFDISLLLAPHLDPKGKMDGPMLRLSLRQVTTGIYFDAKTFLCSRMLEFKSAEFASRKAQQARARLHMKKSLLGLPRRALARTRSRSWPTRGSEGEAAPAGAFSAQSGAHAEDRRRQDADGDPAPQAPSTPQRGMPRVPSFRERQSSTNTATSTLCSESELDGGEDACEGATALQVGLGPSSSHTSSAQAAEEELDARAFLSEDGFDSDANADQLLGAADPLSEDQFSTGEPGGGAGMEGSDALDRFMRHLFEEMGDEQDEPGHAVLSARFDAHDESENKYLFRVETDKLTTMRAAAQRFEVSGSMRNIYHYVHGWAEYTAEQARRRHPMQESAPAARDEDEDTQTGGGHRLLRGITALLSKYIDRPETEFSFALKVTGGLRDSQLVCGIVETPKRRTSRAGAQGSQAARPGVLLENQFNLLEFVADVLAIVEAASA